MSRNYEVPEPILNSPYDEPQLYWEIREGEPPEKRQGRRAACYYLPEPGASESRGQRIELTLVNRIRERLAKWRDAGYPGASRTTLELLAYWRRDGRRVRLFFAQLEAVETIIFLNEARSDFLQGIDLAYDEPSDEWKAKGFTAFRRYASKMATGTGKTAVMGMLAAWSILNKVHDRGNASFSDVVLVVCPNITIRNRLHELDPNNDEASIYHTFDLVPERLMADLTQGRVLVTNWHVFEPQVVQQGGVSAKVSKAGVPVRQQERVFIGRTTTTARGKRYLTLDDLNRQVGAGMLTVIGENKDDQGNLKSVDVESVKYVESDTHLVNRVLGREVGGKQNVLVFNDEGHHAYRLRRAEADEAERDLFGDKEEVEEFAKEATVWVEGLDRIHKLRGINFCVDLSATPYYLARVGQDTNHTFPWVVSDFGLTDAIESGLVKIPQLVVRDTTGAEVPSYFNIWRWILTKLTTQERGARRESPKPEAILKWANPPIAMLAGLWEEVRAAWAQVKDDPRPPVFIIVCANTKLAKLMYEWLAENKLPSGIPPARIEGFLNTDGRVNTIRVDSKVVHETDTEGAKSDESLWMRSTLDTVGKTDWPRDRQGRALYPEGFEELAKKLGRPLHPPGRDVRCIVSVGMLTEGWDCRTVTHIVGLRPFMSQLLCEQVVGRGLRRRDYEVGEDGKLTEEVSKVFGVPFQVIPFKATGAGDGGTREKRHHVHAVPEKAGFEMTYPRIEGYQQAIRNRVTVDWRPLARVDLDPTKIPPEVQVKAALPDNKGRPSLSGPGKLEDVTMNPYRKGRRFQELVFELAADLTRTCVSQPGCEVPSHVLFPQLASIVQRYLREKVLAAPPAHILDVFCSPYYGWVIEQLSGAIRPDTSAGEAPEVPRYESHRGPGSTGDVGFWTSKEVREVVKSHLNYVVADTRKWEQSAAYFIDTHELVDAFVKNQGLGFAIPYLYNGEAHDYVPDFIIRLKTDPPVHLILETKGFDPLQGVKRQAAERWVAAVNAEGSYGRWAYAVVKKPEEVGRAVEEAGASPQEETSGAV